jgi:Spy/CpxP family protein refolding chaperone
MKARITIVALLLTLSTLPLQARQHEEGLMMGQGRQKMIEQLNLSDSQKKDVEKLRFDLMKQMAVHRSKVATARIEYQELVAKDNPDKAAIEKKMKEIADFQFQGRTMFLSHWFNVNKLLNAEQQKTWKKALEGRMFGERREGMRMGGRGMMRERMERRMGPSFRE